MQQRGAPGPCLPSADGSLSLWHPFPTCFLLQCGVLAAHFCLGAMPPLSELTSFSDTSGFYGSSRERWGWLCFSKWQQVHRSSSDDLCWEQCLISVCGYLQGRYTSPRQQWSFALFLEWVHPIWSPREEKFFPPVSVFWPCFFEKLRWLLCLLLTNKPGSPCKKARLPISGCFLCYPVRRAWPRSTSDRKGVSGAPSKSSWTPATINFSPSVLGS